MADVMNFKCPCCGAALGFSGKTGEMTCEYCGASFTMEQAREAQEAEKVDAASSDMTWTTTEQLMITDEDGKIKGYKCPSCAAEMVADENTAATECPYCGNQAIIPQAFDGIYQPEVVIPFSVDKSEAKGKLEEFNKQRLAKLKEAQSPWYGWEEKASLLFLSRIGHEDELSDEENRLYAKIADVRPMPFRIELKVLGSKECVEKQ